MSRFTQADLDKAYKVAGLDHEDARAEATAQLLAEERAAMKERCARECEILCTRSCAADRIRAMGDE